MSVESGHIFLRDPASGESCRTVFLAVGSGESWRASRGEATTSYTSSPSSSPSSVDLVSSSNKGKMLFRTRRLSRATSYPHLLIYGCHDMFMTVQSPLPPSVLHLLLVLKASSRLTSSGRSSITSATWGDEQDLRLIRKLPMHENMHFSFLHSTESHHVFSWVYGCTALIVMLCYLTTGASSSSSSVSSAALSTICFQSISSSTIFNL